MVIGTWSLGAFSCALILDSSFYWMTPDALAHGSHFCLGHKQQQRGALAESTASHSTIFIFDFNSYSLKEAFPKEPGLPLKSMQNLPWVERCNIFLHER